MFPSRFLSNQLFYVSFIIHRYHPFSFQYSSSHFPVRILIIIVSTTALFICTYNYVGFCQLSITCQVSSFYIHLNNSHEPGTIVIDYCIIMVSISISILLYLFVFCKCFQSIINFPTILLLSLLQSRKLSSLRGYLRKIGWRTFIFCDNSQILTKIVGL